MGRMLEALLRLQMIERQLGEVRNRLRTRSAAVEAQQNRLQEYIDEHEALHQSALERQKDADSVELQLKEWAEQISHLRTSLNSTKTNKEYAAILTQINTLKADNSKLEDKGLKLIGEVDEIRTQREEAKTRIAEGEAALEEIKRTSSEEVTRLEGMLAEFETKRAAAAAEVPPVELEVFDRIASLRSGDAMAPIEIHGKKPPHEYICGGCYMSTAAEHANALRTRDELRFCDSCGRILYLEEMAGGGESPPEASERAPQRKA
jgi:predicted  nucleic acid-binding Zn-ribbon protein